MKILNPFIWIYNYLMYSSHLEAQRFNKVYKKYDFSKDIKFF